MFPVKHTVIYTFFAITSVQNTCFCSVFNALASKNPAKSCYVQCFFHFWPFFHCRKATKMTQNSISIPSCAQTPKNPRKMSKTPPYSGLGAKPFLAPPAKADIATAILTNVIEHLVLLLPPNKHAFTAKAVWADSPRYITENLGAICPFKLTKELIVSLKPSRLTALNFQPHLLRSQFFRQQCQIRTVRVVPNTSSLNMAEPNRLC